MRTKFKTILCFIALWQAFALSAQTAKISTAHAALDLTFLIQSVDSIHYNPFVENSKKSIETKQKELVESWASQDSVSIKEVIIASMKLTGMMGGGHTSADWQNSLLYPEMGATKFLPFAVKKEDGKYLIAQSLNDTLKIGTEVQVINGHHIKDLYDEFLTYRAGDQAFGETITAIFIPIYLYLNDIVGPFEIKTTKGTITVEGVDMGGLQEVMGLSLPSVNYEFEILDGNIGHLMYNSCTNYDAFDAFLKETFAQIKKQKIKKLIVDIRQNSGGNSSLNDLLIPYISRKKYQQSSGRYWKVSAAMKRKMAAGDYEGSFDNSFIQKYLAAKVGTTIPAIERDLKKPKKPNNYFKGKAYLLTSPFTFSSANYLADAVKTFRLMKIVGQPTGEHTNDYGEVIEIQLPHSKTYVFVTTTYDIGADGDESRHSSVHPDILVDGDALEYVKERF